MNISWKVILAPIVGWFAGWIGTHIGVTLSPQWQQDTEGLLAVLFTTAAHLLDVYLAQKKVSLGTSKNE
jgi:hypothetical protein